MKTRTRFSGLIVAAFATVLFSQAFTADAARKSPFNVSGLYLEGCSCHAPCPCDLTGLSHGCEGVGVLVLDSGSYAGKNLGGAKVAYAVIPGQWVRVYVDARTPELRQAAGAFARTALSSFGKVESVQDARIAVSGSGGKYTLAVNGGKTIRLTTSPVLGGDKRTVITIHNTNSAISPVFRQAKSVSGTFADGGRSFSFKGTNSYFNDQMKSSGAL